MLESKALPKNDFYNFLAIFLKRLCKNQSMEIFQDIFNKCLVLETKKNKKVL